MRGLIMRITMWVMFIVGCIEIGANSFFLANTASGKGLLTAKKFHGDFPPFASNRAWMNKIIGSMMLGVIALLVALFIYKGYSLQRIISYVFAGGMLLMCIIQAIIYGKKHVPARIGIIIGFAFAAMVYFGV